ncbi:MAG TPA: c-type cytochrome [Novosphingobium sp.]|nr:c-type cytochrome [Novosphingobium sp.]
MTISIRPAMGAALAALSLVCGGQAAQAADAKAGEAIFKQRCQMCHVIAPGQKGVMAPNLTGVIGRKAGSGDFAAYSPALKAWGKAWTPDLIEQFITAPAKLVPGTRMVMTVPTATDRANLVAFLATKR